MEHIQEKLKSLSFPLAIIISGTILSFSALHSFLLFHTVAELFTIIIAFGIFVVAWASRNYSGNRFLLIFGIGYLFVGVLDFLHMLSYDGMEVIRGPGAVSNLSAQLWIAARFLEAASFLIALLFLKGEYRKNKKSDGIIAYIVLSSYSVIFTLVLLVIFYLEIFPIAYIDNIGLTAFKKVSEFVICLLFIVALIILVKKRKMLDKEMATLLTSSLGIKIASEITFIDYFSVYNFSYMLGHLLKFISFILLYKAVLELGIVRPYAFLFSNLKKSEERYRSLVDFSPDPIVVHTNEGIFYVNKPARKLFGIKQGSDLRNVKLVNFFHPDHRNLIINRIKKITEERYKQTELLEFRVLCPDGRIILVEMKGERINYEGKIAVESIIRDVSERRRIEKELADTQLELRKRVEQQLTESYNYLGLVNRKISLLLELESHTQKRKNKQEIVDYILNSAISLSGANVGFLYVKKGRDYFNLLSSSGVEKEMLAYFKRVSRANIGFIEELLTEKKRINGPCRPAKRCCFRNNPGVTYYVVLPLMKEELFQGFFFLGFKNLKSLDTNDLRFLDVFSKYVSSALNNSGILRK